MWKIFCGKRFGGGRDTILYSRGLRDESKEKLDDQKISIQTLCVKRKIKLFKVKGLL